MSKTSFTFNLVSMTYSLQITMNIEALNIHIENSHQITKSKDMDAIITIIMNKSCYKQLAAAGFARSKASLIREWKAHNVLHRLGFEKNRTEAVDLNQNETKLRRIGYFFLSMLYKG